MIPTCGPYMELKLAGGALVALAVGRSLALEDCFLTLVSPPRWGEVETPPAALPLPAVFAR